MGLFLRCMHPEVYQGGRHLKNYFEGWYYKLVSRDRAYAISLIPGVSLNKQDAHAFIQTVSSDLSVSRYVRYPVSGFSAATRALDIHIGSNNFTDRFLSVDIAEPDLQINGRVEFGDIIPFPKAILRPGIMGPFTFLPCMECNHGVVNIRHKLSGTLEINGRIIDFYGGTGYIEKDWGRSFPKSWVWAQGNVFGTAAAYTDASFMISAADIPFLGGTFYGCIAFMYANGHYYPIATYNGGRVAELSLSDQVLHIILKNAHLELTADIKRAQGSSLLAPDSGQMKRPLEETLLTNAHIQLKKSNGHVISEGDTACASYETGGSAGIYN